ncbi:MAG TPA: GAF domain-containing protein, partial [Stenomitos sp.]
MTVREQRQSLEALSEVSRALASALSLPEFFFLAIRATARAFGAYKGNIWRYDPARQRAWIEAAYQVPPDLVERMNRLFEDPDWCARSPTGTAIRTRKVVMIADLEQDERFPQFRPWGQAWGFRSAVYVPLIYGNRAIGSMSLYFPERTDFDETDALFLQTVAAQVATAMVANERLGALQIAKEDLEHRQRELETLTSQSAQHRLLQTIIEELPAGIAFVDDRLKIRLANPAFVRSLSANLDRIQDQPLTAIA